MGSKRARRSGGNRRGKREESRDKREEIMSRVGDSTHSKHDQDDEIEGREQREEERKKKAETKRFQQGGMVEKRVSP